MAELIEIVNPIENEIEKGKVYKITSPQTTKIYIGSTFKPLSFRLDQHKQAYSRFLNGKGKTLGAFDVIKFQDCIIEELESFEGLTRKALTVIERKWYDVLKSNGNDLCNINIPNRTKQDWEVENKIFLDNWKKEYRVKNKEKFNKFANEYYHNNKEKVIETQKKYQERNKEKISQYYKEYYLRKKQEKQQQEQPQEVKEEVKTEIRQIVITLDLMYH